MDQGDLVRHPAVVIHSIADVVGIFLCTEFSRRLDYMSGVDARQDGMAPGEFFGLALNWSSHQGLSHSSTVSQFQKPISLDS